MMYDHFDPPPHPLPARMATLLDVTLRDGGFEVDFRWPHDLFELVPTALGAVGVDIVELGYIGGVPLEHSVAQAGIGANLTPEHIERARRDGPTLAAMVHPSALAEPLDLEPYAAAGLTMLRMVYHPQWFTAIAELAAHARDIGLTTAVNIALVSRYKPTEVATHAAFIQDQMNPDIIYLADTCSALGPGQVHDLVTRLRARVEADIGFHAHDFLNLAYANALAAVEAGATYIDCSLLGLGRGGGNLAAEPLLLRHRLPTTTHPGAMALLLAARSRLSMATERDAATLLPVVCGALNLTPVEEQALREFATTEQIDIETAALWLVTRISQVTSLRREDLRALWHHHIRECAR
jgi:4-hydroxy 2-oxovalerate aldolase